MTVILGAKFPFLTSESFSSYDQGIKTTNAHAIAIYDILLTVNRASEQGS